MTGSLARTPDPERPKPQHVETQPAVADLADTERLDELISAERIRLRISELAREIDADYRDRPLTLVVVLKGATIFAADLMREIAIPFVIDFISASSYGRSMQSSGTVVVRGLKKLELRGRHVLLIEDIVDSGLTIHAIIERLRRRGAASVALCALLHKEGTQAVETAIAYKGFVIPDRFVVGYGLDYAERFRNLRGVYTLTPGTAGNAAG